MAGEASHLVVDIGEVTEVAAVDTRRTDREGEYYMGLLLDMT